MTTGEHASDDRRARDLDDDLDREELRERYYGLLQELRVVLPGVQVLVGFLLTVPFASRFPELGSVEKFLFGVALTSSMLSVVAFVGPTAFHRVGPRTARSTRLQFSIWQARFGLALLAVALVSAICLVSMFVFGNVVAAVVTAVVTVGIVSTWLVIPLLSRDVD
jgi:hypothetical protein